jgi:NADPH:quinone reductase-like Zn-dependent oxidoreductase
MKAVLQDAYGGPGTLRLQHEVQRPRIGEEEVLVQVRAAGVDRGVWHLMTGRPHVLRLAMGFRGPRRRVPGMDLSGVVAAVGGRVTRFRPGDEVFGVGTSAYADFARAPERKLTAKPPSLTFEQAAALPISGSTALQAVRDHGAVAAGDRVLVIGASGGVGSYAVQIAKHAGAEVTAVCSASKMEFVRALGADQVVDYRGDAMLGDTTRYDVIIDIGGNNRLSALRRALTDDGTLVIVGGEGGDRWFGGMDRGLRAAAMSPFLRQKLVMMLNREKHEDIAELGDLATSGAITPAVETTYPLAEAARALRHLEEGRVHGKLVLTV